MSNEFYSELERIEDKYNALYTSDFANLNSLLDAIILEVNSIEYMPKVIISRAVYERDNARVIDRVKFVIRPTVRYNLNIHNMKVCFTIFESKSFFTQFIDNIRTWREEYELYSLLEYNLGLLNTKITEILHKIKFPYSITFALGEGITDISDNSIELGLSMEKIMDIPNLGFFIEDEYWNSCYVDKFINVLKECNRPYDIVKVKSDITKELGIYNRRSISNLIRKFICRSANHVRVGLGYIDVDGCFAIIEKIAVNENKVDNYNLDEVIVLDNDNASIVEKRHYLNKIIIKYKLTPFDKQTNVMVDRNIREFMDDLMYRKGGNEDE